MALIVYMSLVGIYKIAPHEYEHMPYPDLHKGENNMVRYLMTNLGGYHPFNIFEGGFMHFKETTNQDFFKGPFEVINEKLVLALFCTIYNSFNIVISQHYHDDEIHKKYFTKFRDLILERSKNIKHISEKAMQIIAKVPAPPSTFHYITNMTHQHVEMDLGDDESYDEDAGSGSNGSFESGMGSQDQSFGSLNE